MTSESFFEKLKNQYFKKLPFVAYRKSNESKIKAFLQTDDSLYLTSGFTESGFVFAPFDDREDAIIIPLLYSNYLEDLIAEDKKIQSKNISQSKSRIPHSLAAREHINLVKKAIKTIKSGVLKKVVLSRKEKMLLEEQNPIAIFQKLAYNYTAAFTYIWYHPKVGLWLGATPETLLRISANRLSTMALAGTQPYLGSMDVVWGAKEQEEQQLVVDYILKSLKSSVKDVKASPTSTAKAGSLLHLKTQITGKLEPENSIKSLIKSLHPTPAICGLPRENAKQFILENESYNREFYTGFLGELNIKETAFRNRNKRNVENNAYSYVKTVTNLFVNLRCMQIIDAEAYIYVGGGITKDSIPENEFEETITKTNTMKKVL